MRITKTWYRSKVTKCCYKNGANRLTQHRVITNLPLKKKKKRYLQSGIKQGTPVLRATGVSKCRKYCQALFRLFSLLNRSWFSPPCERSHLFKKNIFFNLFGCAGSYLVAHRIYSHDLWIRSCSMWDLVPWLGIEPDSLHWEIRILATGPPGKSLQPPFNTKNKDYWSSNLFLTPTLRAVWIIPSLLLHCEFSFLCKHGHTLRVLGS